MPTTATKRTVRTQVGSPRIPTEPSSWDWRRGQGVGRGGFLLASHFVLELLKLDFPMLGIFLSFPLTTVQRKCMMALWPETVSQAQSCQCYSCPNSHMPRACLQLAALCLLVTHTQYQARRAALVLCPMSLTMPPPCPGEKMNVDAQPALSVLFPALGPGPSHLESRLSAAQPTK